MKKIKDQKIKRVWGHQFEESPAKYMISKNTDMIDADFRYLFNRDLYASQPNHEMVMAGLERRILGLSEDERSTIARDLHNDIGSHLCGVELLCKVLQKKLAQDAPDRAEELEIIRDLIRQAIGSIPPSSRDLSF